MKTSTRTSTSTRASLAQIVERAGLTHLYGDLLASLPAQPARRAAA
jgi:hypothetical protein